MSAENKDNTQPSSTETQFIKGRNWGELTMTDKELVFKGDDKQWFNLPINSLANVVQTSNKNEIGLEFNMEEENNKDFLLCEMHFFIPEDKKQKNDQAEGEDSERPEDEEHPEDEDEPLTFAETLKEQLTKIVNIGNVSNSIARIPELQMITPRGKFDVYFMESFIKIHGQSHNYKINFKNISKAFILPKIDGHNHFFVIALHQAISQGNTSYPFLIFQIRDEQEASIDLNIPEKLADQIDLENPLVGNLTEVLPEIFQKITNVGVVVKSKNFTFSKGPCIKCVNKASEGALYPLDRCLLFLHKPVIYIPHEDIKQISLLRTDQSTINQRSFDLDIETKNEKVSFTGFEKSELDAMINYFNAKKLKLIHIDESNNQMEPTINITSRRQRAVVDEQPMELPSEESLIGDDDYDDEDDEDMEGDEDEEEEEESKHKEKKHKHEHHHHHHHKK